MTKLIEPTGEYREVNFKLLLTGLCLLILTGPLLRQYGGWEDPILIKVIFGTASILFVTSLTHDLRVFLLALVPALAMLVFAILAVAFGNPIFQYLMLLAAFVFCMVAVRYASEEVFLSGLVNLNKIVGSVCIFLLLVVAWAILYEFLELLTPGSFTGLSAASGISRFDEFTYFSLVTITTLGYGDISPDNLVSGLVAGLEALVGVFYIAVLVASLVGDFMSHRGQKNRA